MVFGTISEISQKQLGHEWIVFAAIPILEAATQRLQVGTQLIVMNKFEL